MNIILANLPWRNFLKTGVRAGSRWPHLKGPAERDYLPFPFFLAYSASLLKKNDFDVTLIDAIAEEMFYGHFLKVIQSMKPDLIVCETSTVTLEHDLKLLAKIDRNISIALCGPDINIRQPLFLKNHSYIKYVLVGEYEFTLLDLVRHLREGRDLSAVLGLIYRSSTDIKINHPRPLVDLDKLPWPLRQREHINRYNDAPGDLPTPSAQMLASRGCPYKCKFCLWPQVMYQSNRYRTRSAIDVVDEMEYLVKELNYKSIYFDDDTFNIGKERMLSLSSEIKKRKLNVPWAIMARADLMDEEILKIMRDAGLYAVKYGVESCSQKLLDSIDKNMDIRKTEDIVKSTKILGIKTHLTFTFGLPGETRETIHKTINFALGLDPTTIQFSIATPFPGTAFYKYMKEKNCIVSENWAEYDGNNKSVINSAEITKTELERGIKLAYRQWSIYCTKRDPFKRSGYIRLITKSLKRYGVLTTFVKAVMYLKRHSTVFIKDKILYKASIDNKIKENGLKAGRLSLIFDTDGLGLYWDGMKLTKGEGFSSSFISKDKTLPRVSNRSWKPKKINDMEILLTRVQDGLDLEEVWRIKVLDEKQIDWSSEICLKNGTEALLGKIMLVLSGRYNTWIDSWGEGRFYPVNDHREVQLRNPNTNFIGLRGRKKLKGQLPTILLDLSKDNDECSPSVKNANSVLGARLLKIQKKISNGSSVTHKLFSVRVKIVEEDFDKRRLNKKK